MMAHVMTEEARRTKNKGNKSPEQSGGEADLSQGQKCLPPAERKTDNRGEIGMASLARRK